MKRKIIKRSSSTSPKGDDFKPSDISTAATRIAVAQICQSVGYRSAQNSALQTLTDVAVSYLRSLAASAAASAASTGRTECNLLDVVRGLEDLHSVLGFRGNSEPKSHLHFLSDSSILCDAMKFVRRSREIPFARPFPPRRLTVPANPPCNFDSGDCSRWSHIPRWLPAFPQEADGAKPDVAAGEGEIKPEKMLSIENNPQICKIGKLPEKRKKVSFKIGGVNDGRKRIEVDFRCGICKGGKRISCQIYDEDDEKVVNCSSNVSDHDADRPMKKKLVEVSPRMKMIMMN